MNCRNVFQSARLGAALVLSCAVPHASAAEPARMERVVVSKDGRGFALADSGRSFTPWGFNYDHDDPGRLIEDYWEREWPMVEEDFREMKELGANVVRIHLQFAKFMETAEKPNAAALAKLSKLLALAERTGLHLDLTGLGCYHKQDVPPWYDALDEKGRWEAQAKFWEAIAAQCKDSTSVFCYDLMNEPVVAGGRRKAGEWLGPPFGGKHFVQFITLDAAGREPHAIARNWTRSLVAAIRKHDRRALVTVGLVDWSLDRPGLRSGFVPDKIAPELDFISVHLYPKRGALAKDLETLRGFAVGKPVVIEETFTLHAGMPEFGEFVKQSRGIACGWIGFYWGKTLAECRKGRDFKDALMASWLEWFQREALPHVKPR